MSFNLNLKKSEVVTASGTFGQSTITMPRADDGMLPAIIGIRVKHPKLSNLDAKYSRWQITNVSKSAAEDEDSMSVLASGHRQSNSGSTTKGDAVEDVWENYPLPAPMLIRSEELYFGVIQDTGSAHTYKVEVQWVPRTAKKIAQVNEIKVNSAW